MDFALFTQDGFNFMSRWIHFLAGVTWIGILYYFNYVQGEWFKEVDAGVKGEAVKKLVPRALWWFRWGAMFTWVSGMILLTFKGHLAGPEVYSTSWGIFILPGALMGTYMFLNVWLVIWPNQKIVIAKAQGLEVAGDPAVAGPKAALASRTNTLFSIPMLFFMGAASHLPLNLDYGFNPKMVLGVVCTLITLIELNGLKGKMGPMASVKGVIHAGVGLTFVLYFIIEFMT